MRIWFKLKFWKAKIQDIFGETHFVSTESLLKLIKGPSVKNIVSYEGPSLRGGGQGFSSATMNVGPGYFQRKIEEK